MPRRVPRKELALLPDFLALRHNAAMDCEDAEEARGLLRHRNSSVTRALYRAHFEDNQREQLRARMEARMDARFERDLAVPQACAARGRLETRMEAAEGILRRAAHTSL